MGPTGDDIHVLQIHPSLRCNLRCLHCYSSSSPEAEGELAFDLLQQAVTDARAEGFNVLSVSGGEPLLFHSLAELLQSAKTLGMITTVTTNGMLLTERRLAELCDVVDLLAISLDGVADSHNRIRSNPRAFETMCQRLEGLRRTKLRFGFIFALTQHNLHELDAVARFAVEQGAALLQVHPLEAVGRAHERLAGATPDRLELAYTFLEVARLQKLYQGKLQVQFDVVDLEFVRNHPERVFAGAALDLADAAHTSLAELASPLVLQHDGLLVPIQYGFAHTFAIGNLKERSLRQLAAHWKTNGYPAFMQLCRDVYQAMGCTNASELPFENWYGRIMQASYRSAAMPR